MPRNKTASCTTCGTPMWSNDLAAIPRCRACRAQTPRPKKHSVTNRIGCVEPKWPTCWTCGASMHGKHGQRYCSRPCQPSEIEKIARSIVTFRCSWCDHEARGVVARGHSPVCSAKCQRALTLYLRGWNASPWHTGVGALWTGKQRRKARIALTSDGPINRRAVFERDNWTCHLCARKVEHTRSVPHPRAATIDHLIPLALGGAHTLANVATACFECNTRKGVRACGEQLALIG